MERKTPTPGQAAGGILLGLFLMLGAVVSDEILDPDLALATLGEQESTVERDRAVSRGTHTTATAQGGVRIHTIQSSVSAYREYIAPDGTVFAVTWQGMNPPHLKAILGTYATEYRDAIARFRTQTTAPRIRGRFLRLTTPNLLIDGGGQPRALSGRVILPAHVPPGFPLDQIR
ncbi:MAG: DUF2844 domain-containing protein [Leptospirales bacterium]